MSGKADCHCPDPPEGALSEAQFRLYAEDLIRVYREEKAKRQELQSANEKIQAILDSMSDGMAAVDRDGVTIEVNAEMCRMIGLDRETLQGAKLTDHLGGGELEDALAEVRSQGAGQRFSLEIQCPDRHVLRLTLSGMQNGFVVALAHDITAERRAQNVKSEFLALLSHELRTPLNGIIGFSSLLSSSELNVGEIRSMAGFIKESGERMSRTISELLNFADVQFDRLDSMEHLFDIASEMEAVVSLVAKEAMSSAMRVDMQVQGRRPVMRGNPYMLRDMVWHLLDNAVKFGKIGGTVELLLSATDDQVLIRVSDDGPGVPLKERVKIFESFYQIQEYLTRNREGLGLGLTLAKRIAELHGGSLILESGSGPGASFLAVLPLAPDVRS